MRSGTYTAATAEGGTILCVDKRSGKLVHAREDASEQLVAFVHIPINPRFAYILFDNPELVPLSTADRTPSSPIIPLRWRRMPGDCFALFEPASDSYLVASPDVSEEGLGTLRLVAPELDEGSRFKVREASDGLLTQAVRHQTDLIGRVAASSPITILDVLRNVSAADRPTVSALLAETLIASEVEVLVDYLFQDRERLDAFASLFPDDPWAATGLGGLFDFIRARQAREAIRPFPRRSNGEFAWEPTQRVLLGPDLDRLATAGPPGGPLVLPHRCTITARSKVPPIRDFCIVATARNDGPYLLDWLAYHQAIGVDRVFLYTNDNEDGSDALLRALAEAGELSLIESKLSIDGVSPVSKAYGHALSMLPEILDYRWCAIIDSDEYIGVDRTAFSTIKQFVEWQELKTVDVIFLNWLVFGSSGALRWKNEPLPVRFQERYLDGHVKAIFRPRFFHHAMPHFPYTRLTGHLTSRDAEGNVHRSYAAHSTEPRDSPAWIAHYFFRSFEEFVWKFSRGRGDQPLLDALRQAEIPEGFMGSFITQQRDLRLVTDGRVLAFGRETARRLRHLKNLPGVPEALGVIHGHYRRKSESLEPTLRALRVSASPTQSAFYDLFLGER